MQDISEFEYELFMDSLTYEEKKRLGVIIPETKKGRLGNPQDRYYWPEKNSYVYTNEPGVDELIKEGKVIPFWQYVYNTFVKPLQEGKSVEFISSSLPIIFKQVGKTPQSCQYLKVHLSASLGGEDAFHSLYLMTRSNNETVKTSQGKNEHS